MRGFMPKMIDNEKLGVGDRNMNQNVETQYLASLKR